MAWIQKFADMTANARTEGLRLEQDLTSARQFDSSARLRNENLAKEQVNEETRSSAAVAKISDRLGDCESKMASLRNKQSNFQKEVDGKQEMLRGLRQRLFEFHSLQNCPSSHELGSVSADSVWEKLQRAVAREQDAVNDQIAAKHRVEAALESAVHDKAKKEEDIVRVNENCQTISKRLHEGKEIEAERRASSEMALGKLTKLREEVDFLHTTLGQLQKTKEQEIADGTRFIDEQSRLRQKRQDDLDHMRQELETENSQLDDLKKSNHDMDNLNRERIENAKGVLDAAQKSAEQLRGHGEQLASEEAYEAEIQGEIESIKTARAFLVRDVEAEIAHIRKSKYIAS
jgi:chromosome segregation ATPase